MGQVSKTVRSAGIGASNLSSWVSRRGASSVNALDVFLSGQVPEEAGLSGLWRRLMPAPHLTMRDLLSGLELAADNPQIKLALLRVARHDLGWGRAFELAEAIARFRARGKRVVAYLEQPENVDFLLAAACDKVVAPPGTPFYLTGLLSEVMYFKGVMDKLAIEPEMFQAGKYKSAIEPYTREGMSRAHREAVESLLDSIFGLWVKAMAEGRGMSEDQVRRLIDGGPWLSEEAKEEGLVDALLYEDELEDYIEKWMGLSVKRVGLDKFFKYFGPRASMADPWRKLQTLAIITASGPIHGGESRYYGGGDGTIGADTLRRALREAREDDSIAAAVLRVDSPGGSAVHSDLIWREVVRLAKTKPVIASMADVAASGGYYIAMPADKIIASPTTLTGSIGVIGGKMNFKGLYEKIGIKKERVARGKHADLVTDYGPLTPELRGKLRREMDSVYKIFVDKAAKSRKRDAAEMEKAAQGRVWTGDQARGLGLVDELGHLIKAVERAKEMAGISLSRRVPVVSLPRAGRPSFPSLPFHLPFSSGAGPLIRTALKYEAMADARVLAHMPYLPRIK